MKSSADYARSSAMHLDAREETPATLRHPESDGPESGDALQSRRAARSPWNSFELAASGGLPKQDMRSDVPAGSPGHWIVQ